MIIKRVVRDKDGSIEATLLLSNDQAAFLINMGLVTLVSAGSVQVLDISEEEYKKQQEGNSEVTSEQKADDLSFLQNVDPNKLHKA